MTTILTRSSQVAIKIEGTEGTEEALIAADFLYNPFDEEHLYDPTMVDRAVTRGTLTQMAQLAGSRMAEIHFGNELVGGGVAKTALWHSMIRVMGFAVTTLKIMTVGSFSGGAAFRVGQLLGDNTTQSSATKLAQFVCAIGSKAVIRPITGTFVNTDTLYNYDSPQVSAVIGSTLTDAGVGFTPQTETASVTPPSATVERRLGGEKHTIVGSRGRGSMSFNVNEVPKIKGEFRGCPKMDPSHPGRPRTAANVVLVPEGAKPKTAAGMTVMLGGTGGYSPPVLTKCEIDFGIELADRPTITASDLVSSGNLSPRIGSRKMSISIDPEYVLGATRDFVADCLNGTTFEFYSDFGVGTDTNGRIIVYAPQAQITGQQKLDDKNGIAVNNLKLDLGGEQDDELCVFHVFGS